jgi:hypothetical protein
MIYESEPWREELVRIASRLEKRYTQKRWSERSFYLLEKEIFLGAFAARKLIESRKVSDRVAKSRIQVARYPAGSEAITLLNQHKFQELYNLYANEKESLTYRDICNQFIHSSIFAPFVPFGKALVGVFVASDRSKSEQLYYMPSVRLIELFQSIGFNSPHTCELRFDEDEGDYIVEML